MDRVITSDIDVEALVDLRSPSGSLISVYLDRPTEGATAALSELLKPLKAKAEGRHREVARSVRVDSARIADLAQRLAVDPAPAFAVFASHADRLFEVIPLAEEVGEWVDLGHEPLLRPLRAMNPVFRSGVAVVERGVTRVYESSDGVLEELAVLDSDIGKSNFGGFKGYEEHRVRHRAEHEVARMFKEVSAVLLERHRARPLDLVVLTGHADTVESLVPHLHPYLQQLPRRTFVADPHTLTAAQLTDLVRDAVVRVREAQEETIVAETLAAAHQGVPVAEGTSAVLAAVNARAVDRLVISGRFSRTGVRCAECRCLARSGETCPVCGAPTVEVTDVLAAAIESVLANGGAVNQVSVASPLDAHGVVAVLRFPVA